MSETLSFNEEDIKKQHDLIELRNLIAKSLSKSPKTDEELIDILVGGGMLSEALVPTATNASFEWDFDSLSWQYSVDGELVGDPIIETFIASIGTSSITYDTFVGKSINYSSYSSNYNPTSWNGYLEMILE
ncbi:hypothetical protein EOM09_04945, partial [bacterium]|nr:hypothetical protein [bacterium]